MNKSEYSSNKSYERDYKNYTPTSENQVRSEDWNSYEKDSESEKKNRPGTNNEQINELHARFAEVQISEEVLRMKLKEKEAEITSFKNANYEMANQIKALQESLQKKEKDLVRAMMEKEFHVKSEEELKKIVQEFRNRESEFVKENNELKDMYELMDAEKKHVESELKEAENLIKRLQKTLKIKEDAIMTLHQSRNDLEKELGSVSQSKFDPNKIDFKRLKIPEARNFSTSPERFEYNLTERGEDLNFKVVCQEVMKIVGVTSTKDLYSKLLHIKQYHSKYKRSRKLIDKISDMIVQCSPIGSFTKEPNSHQIWRWLTRLLEEYMKLKQSIIGEGYLKLCEMLKTDNIELILEKVENLLKSSRR